MTEAGWGAVGKCAQVYSPRGLDVKDLKGEGSGQRAGRGSMRNVLVRATEPPKGLGEGRRAWGRWEGGRGMERVHGMHAWGGLVPPAWRVTGGRHAWW